MSKNTSAVTIGVELLEIAQEGGKINRNAFEKAMGLTHSCQAGIKELDKRDAINEHVCHVWSKQIDHLVPETGISDKNGEEFQLRWGQNEKNKPEDLIKFRQWEDTTTQAKHLSAIAKAIEMKGFDAVFPNGNESFLTLREVRELGKEDKVPETPMETIRRCQELINQKVTEVTELADVQELDILFAQANIEYTTHANVVKANALAKASNA